MRYASQAVRTSRRGIRNWGLGCWLIFAALVPASAGAAGFEVTTAVDSGPGSLRQAIAMANDELQHPGLDTVTFSPGVGSQITITSGPLTISSAVEIQGPGAQSLAISGSDASRVFTVTGGPSVISGLTVRDGRHIGPAGVAGEGGGVLNSADLTLRNLVLTANDVIGPAGVGTADGSDALGGGVASSGQLTLERVTVSSNTATGGAGGDNPGATAGTPGEARGAGVYAGPGSELTVTDSAFLGNQALGGPAGAGSSNPGGRALGGGVDTHAATTISDSTIRENSATGAAGAPNGHAAGGGISAIEGVTLQRSTLSGNEAASPGTGFGGGIYSAQGTLISDSTVHGNAADGVASLGGGIFHAGSLAGALAIRYATITDNSAINGANIAEASNDATIRSSIVAHPRVGQNCGTSPWKPVGSLGHNIDDGSNCGFDEPTDKPNTDPLLGPLQANGGPTDTQRLLPGSPAIDAGAPGSPTDQRGVPRPQDHLGIPNAADGSDIGAYELAAPPRPRCRGLRATIVGSSRGEQIKGTSRRDVIHAGGGRDRVLGRGGNDVICGGPGGDRVFGGAGRDVIFGQGARDRLFGGRGRDLLLGGGGPDLLVGGPGRDRLVGGPGRDRPRQ